MNTTTSRDPIGAHVLQRLGESGQPPDFGIDRVNVGNESYLKVLEEEYFEKHLRSGASFKLVQGYFGGGKTHFLHCIRELAWRHAFAVALVELSPTECPYDDSLQVYANVARRIATRPPAPGEQTRYGFTELLRNAVDSRLDALQSDTHGVDPEEARRQCRVWLRRVVGRAPCESNSFRRAAVEFCLAWLDDDFEREQRLEAWLRAEPVPRSDVRDFSVYETMSRKNGFLMLRSLTQIVPALGFGGTTLLFDEVDRNLSVSEKRTQAMGDNLRQVIDLCGRHQLPSTLFVYAVPPEFMLNVVPDYPALQQRLRAPVPMGERNPQAVLIDLEHLDLEPEKLLSAMGSRIIDVFCDVYPGSVGRPLQQKNVDVLASACVQSQFDVNHRRLFAKTLVDLLQNQRVDGERKLSKAQADAFIEDGHRGLEERSNERRDILQFEDF
ncbi:MAG: BREX system ATP-binding domain-containing protein [Myxococcota bacterium]